MLDSRNLLEVLTWGPGESLYRDSAGRRVVLDIEGQVAQWGASPGVVRDAETTEALVLQAVVDGPVFAWAVGGPAPTISKGNPVYGSIDGPCWLSDVEGLTRVDGQVGGALDVPLVPVLWEAQFNSALHHPCQQCLDLVAGPNMGQPEKLGQFGWTVKSSSKVIKLDSTFAVGTRFAADHLAHLGPASWDVVSDGDGSLILEKVYDRFHGLQRARVMVDGESVGIWQAMRSEKVSRWGISRFGLPPGLPARFRVTVDPLPGTPLWDVAYYRIWELRDKSKG